MDGYTYRTDGALSGDTPSAEKMNRLFGEASLRAGKRIDELDASANAAGQEAGRAARISLQSLPTDILGTLEVLSVRSPAK